MTQASWIPPLPVGWSQSRIGHEMRFTNGMAFKPNDWKSEGLPIIRIENLNGSEDFNFADPQSIERRYLIEPGDLLFAWSGNRGTSFGPFVWRGRETGVLNQHIFRVHDIRLEPRYCYWVLRAATAEIEQRAHGIIGLVHVTGPTLRRMEIPVPPSGEQRRIADFLDRETARIDELVSAKSRLEDLLWQRWQARCEDALADDFHQLPLKRMLSTVDQGWSPVCVPTPAGSGENGILKVGAVNAWNFRAEENKRLPPEEPIRPEAEVRDGDLIASRANTTQLLGSVSVASLQGVPCRLFLSDKHYRLIPRAGHADTWFLALALRSRGARAQIEGSATGASPSMQNISRERLLDTRIPAPPLGIQERIASRARHEHDLVARAAAKIRSSIAAGNEYRASLITEAVTGQLDPRRMGESAMEERIAEVVS